MNIREICTSLDFGKEYFNHFWLNSNKSETSEYKPFQDSTKSLFIHIPKTAGVSLNKSLYKSNELWGHAPAIAYKNRDKNKFNSYFKFSFIRDPIDRFYSAFHYLKDTPLTERDKVWAINHLSQYHNIESLLDHLIESRFARGKILSWVHFLPQAWFITDLKGNLIVDYVKDMKDYDCSIAEIAEKLQIPLIPVKTNQSKRPKDIKLSTMHEEFLKNFYLADYDIINRISLER